MTFTYRQRRRILLALLPLLAFVWATLPALPCCHDVAAGNEITMAGEMAAHAGHHGSAALDDGSAHDGRPDPHGFAVEHGANHCEDAPAPGLSPPCTDIEKSSNDVRPAYVAAPLLAITSVLPVLQVEPAASPPPLPDRTPPPRYRPLHLEKSVLLI